MLDFGNFNVVAGDSSSGNPIPSQSSMRQTNAEKGSRYDLMLSEEYKKKLASQLLYHTNCMELLVACAQGGTHGPVTRLRNLMSWDDLISNILDLDVTSNGRTRKLDPSVLHRVKAPFLRLLTETYLREGEATVEDVPEDSAPDSLLPRWWTHDENKEIKGEEIPSLVDEFIQQIDSFTARLRDAEAAGLKFHDAEVILGCCVKC